MKRQQAHPSREQPALSRRTVVEWLGKAAVLALGGELTAGCLSAEDPHGPTPVPPGPRCDDDTGFEFAPGPRLLEVFREWRENSVDAQDLAELLGSWQLTVDGMVAAPEVLSFADLLELPREDHLTDLHCIEGWSVLDVPWNGVHLSTLLDRVGPQAGATYVTFHSAGGRYLESLPIDVALEPRTLLAYGVGCNTLPMQHGFPLRVVVPRKYGYKHTKHVERIELTDEPVEGYWVRWGYPYDADVAPHRLRPGKY